MSTSVSEIRAGIDRALTEVADLAERHGSNPERWSPGVTHRIEGLRRHIETSEAEIDARAAGSAEREDQRSRAFNAAVAGQVETVDPIDRPFATGSTRDAARRLIDDRVRAKDLPDYAAERAVALVERGPARDRGLAARWVTVTGAPEYATAFGKLAADPERGHLDWTGPEADAFRAGRALQAEFRAMSLSDASGGFLVPFTLDPTITLTSAGTTNTMRSVARVVQTATDSWNGVTSAGATASWDAEGAQVSDDSPTLVQPSIPVYKGAAFVPFTIEVGMDAGPGFLDELGSVLRDSAQTLAATAYTTGSGVGEPKGLITALAGTASLVTPTVAETLSSADCAKVQGQLPARWQAAATWQANLQVINLLDAMTISAGIKIFPEVGSLNPVLLRKRLYENSDMDGAFDASVTANNYLLAYGDFRQFVIADRIGTSIELIPHLFGANGRPTGSRGAYMYFRTGSDVTTINAFRLLNLATTA